MKEKSGTSLEIIGKKVIKRSTLHANLQAGCESRHSYRAIPLYTENN